MRIRRHSGAVLTSLLAFVFVFLLSMPLFAASPTLSAELKPSIDKKTVTVVFSVENNPGIAAFRFSIHYDNQVLKPTGAAMNGKVTGGLFFDNHQDAVTIWNVVWANGTNYIGNGELCSATFSVIGTVEDGKYPITVVYDPADIINQEPQSVTFEVKGMTASAQTVSAQSTPSNPSSASAVSRAQSSSPVPTSSVTASAYDSSVLSDGTSAHQIQVNSQIPAPDYEASGSSGGAYPLSPPSASGDLQNSAAENNPTTSPETGSETLSFEQSPSSQAQIPAQSDDRQKPDILTVAVMVIAASALIVLTVLIIQNKKKTQ